MNNISARAKRISFKNMAGCYREELEQLLRGEIATRVLTRARVKEASVIDPVSCHD